MCDVLLIFCESQTKINQPRKMASEDEGKWGIISSLVPLNSQHTVFRWKQIVTFVMYCSRAQHYEMSLAVQGVVWSDLISIRLQQMLRQGRKSGWNKRNDILKGDLFDEQHRFFLRHLHKLLCLGHCSLMNLRFDCHRFWLTWDYVN